MQDSTLLSIALVVACIGILALAMISSIAPPDQDNPVAKEDGEKITLKGKVISSSSDAMKTRIMVEIPVEVVVFDTSNLSALRKGDSITVKGSVQEYQGKKSVLAESVRTG